MINFKELFQNMLEKKVKNFRDMDFKQFQIDSAKTDILL